jgi:hypothetical protein
MTTSRARTLSGYRGYSPIFQQNFVKWNDSATARELRSAVEIMTAKSNGKLRVTRTNRTILINSPAVQQ